MMDIVYVVSGWPNNNIELRYSLRWLSNIPHWKVFIIGDKPERVRNVIHIPFKDNPKYKSKNVIEKIKLACLNEGVSDKFIFMCDDFYIKDKIKDIPYLWKWTIWQQVKIRENMAKKWQNFSFPISVIKNTFDMKDKDFENHFPFIYEKEKFLKMLDIYDFSIWNLYRSAYCKLYNINWEYSADCKLSIDNYKIRDLSKRKFFSSRNDFAKTDMFKELMDKIFPTPCRYEEQGMSIPKILHCVWVWPLPPPMKWINSWKEKHPDWEYKLRGNEELENTKRINQKAIDYYKSKWKRAGVADCMRYEILYNYWWAMHWADSLCLNPIDDLFLDSEDNYAVDTSHREWEPILRQNKNSFAPLYACKKWSLLARKLIMMIYSTKEYKTPAYTTWNRLMQRTLNLTWLHIKVRPQHYFLPEHYDWRKYTGTDKVYATHFWWTTRWVYYKGIE